MAAGSSERKMRGFKRWMRSNGIECSDAILVSAQNGDVVDSAGSLSISVKAVCDLKEGDVVARIPKQSCLTVKTSAARELIGEAELEGNLAMSVAIMYERNLGSESKWFQYLQILPQFEPIPLLWTPSDIDSLLSGTEIHKVVKEDKLIMYQDWKQCIRPLLALDSQKLNPEFFTFHEYLAARSLLASRSFQIDESHGFGMVPLADLFNHKTAAENVHLTSVSCSSDSEEDADKEDDGDEESMSPGVLDRTPSLSSNMEVSSTSEGGSTFMEMIIVKDVKAGTEVFNTYGLLGNAALLHRYGFTEPDNPYDIVNIDLDLVVQWSSSLITSRQSRRRFRLWRMLDYPESSSSQDLDYFEISSDGEPQSELLVLLYILLLPEEDFHELEYELSLRREAKSNLGLPFVESEGFFSNTDWKTSKKLLLMHRSICQALLSLADAREDMYGGVNSLDDDIRSLNKLADDPKLYYSTLLRIGERKILKKLRSTIAYSAGCIPRTPRGMNDKRKRT